VTLKSRSGVTGRANWCTICVDRLNLQSRLAILLLLTLAYVSILIHFYIACNALRRPGKRYRIGLSPKVVRYGRPRSSKTVW